MKKRTINKSVSFIKKNGVYAFYVDFNFIFLKGVATRLMDAILEKVDQGDCLNLNDVPEDFILYLILRRIIIEEVVI